MDGHAVVLRQKDGHVHLPVGNATALLIQPGTSITHAAISACAKSGCVMLWTGENGVRLYAAGDPGRDATALLRQAGYFSDNGKRLQVARGIFRFMFGEDPPVWRSVEQIRGMEGARVKKIYQSLAESRGVSWNGRRYNHGQSDKLNTAISCANAALYGLTEAVILALGYAPSIGFVHTGDPRSFVYDVADCLKFKTVVPLAMDIAKEHDDDMEGRVRRGCRALFMELGAAQMIVSIVDSLLA